MIKMLLVSIFASCALAHCEMYFGPNKDYCECQGTLDFKGDAMSYCCEWKEQTIDKDGVPNPTINCAAFTPGDSNESKKGNSCAVHLAHCKEENYPGITKHLEAITKKSKLKETNSFSGKEGESKLIRYMSGKEGDEVTEDDSSNDEEEDGDDLAFASLEEDDEKLAPLPTLKIILPNPSTLLQISTEDDLFDGKEGNEVTEDDLSSSEEEDGYDFSFALLEEDEAAEDEKLSIVNEKLDDHCKNLPADPGNEGGCCSWSNNRCGERIGDKGSCYCQSSSRSCELCDGEWIKGKYFEAGRCSKAGKFCNKSRKNCCGDRCNAKKYKGKSCKDDSDEIKIRVRKDRTQKSNGNANTKPTGKACTTKCPKSMPNKHKTRCFEKKDHSGKYCNIDPKKDPEPRHATDPKCDCTERGEVDLQKGAPPAPPKSKKKEFQEKTKKSKSRSLGKRCPKSVCSWEGCSSIHPWVCYRGDSRRGCSKSKSKWAKSPDCSAYCDTRTCATDKKEKEEEEVEEDEDSDEDHEEDEDSDEDHEEDEDSDEDHGEDEDSDEDHEEDEDSDEYYKKDEEEAFDDCKILPGDQGEKGGCCVWGDSDACGKRIGKNDSCYCHTQKFACEKHCGGVWHLKHFEGGNCSADGAWCQESRENCCGKCQGKKHKNKWLGEFCPKKDEEEKYHDEKDEEDAQLY